MFQKITILNGDVVRTTVYFNGLACSHTNASLNRWIGPANVWQLNRRCQILLAVGEDHYHYFLLFSFVIND